jgi:hypothetical protein
VDVLVGREGAVPTAAGRRAHRRRSRRQPRLLAACAVLSAAAAGASTLVLMPDDVAPPRPATGEQPAAHQVGPPRAPAPTPAEPQVVSAEQIAALPSTAAAAPARPRPTRAPTPTDRPQPTRSPERAESVQSEDLELTEEIDELATQLTKRTPDLRGAKARDRGSDGHRRGPKGDRERSNTIRSFDADTS